MPGPPSSLWRAIQRGWLAGALFLAISFAGAVTYGDGLDAVRQRGVLRWGGDAEGGGPYIYSDPQHPEQVRGFEVELANLLAKRLGVQASFQQCQWSELPELLHGDRIDVVLNGYELTQQWSERLLPTRPYYVFDQVLLARADNERLKQWDDLSRPFDGRKARVGALAPSAAYHYLQQRFGQAIDLIPYDGNTDAMREVELGKLDATIADHPVASFYRQRFVDLHAVGRPEGRGFYVAYVRQGEERLCEALSAGILQLVGDGQLQAIYEKYGIWNEDQAELTTWQPPPKAIQATTERGWEVIRSRAGLLCRAALMTVGLAVASMPIAIALGLCIAIVRLYGPWPLRTLAIVYVELLRGTPLLLQLYLIYFMLPELGLRLPAVWAAIVGLSVNYSAYEAEIYRAGILSIPRGQMEAALSLGMTRFQALRRIVIPQAVRVVVPPVTNDFIALFKDTSVCSVITVEELTKRYLIDRNDTGATLELAVLTGVLYLIMSIPLSRLATTMERRLRHSRSAVL